MIILPNKIRLIYIHKEIGSYEQPWKIKGEDLSTHPYGKFLRVMDGPRLVVDIMLNQIGAVQYSEEDESY